MQLCFNIKYYYFFYVQKLIIELLIMICTFFRNNAMLKRLSNIYVFSVFTLHLIFFPGDTFRDHVFCWFINWSLDWWHPGRLFWSQARPLFLHPGRRFWKSGWGSCEHVSPLCFIPFNCWNW